MSSKESIYLITQGTSTTTPSALFWSRTTVNLLLVFILLFLLLFPASEVDRGGHGKAGTEAAMCLETWYECWHKAFLRHSPINTRERTQSYPASDIEHCRFDDQWDYLLQYDYMLMLRIFYIMHHSVYNGDYAWRTILIIIITWFFFF